VFGQRWKILVCDFEQYTQGMVQKLFDKQLNTNGRDFRGSSNHWNEQPLRSDGVRAYAH
jgi:hypothetical protein